MKNPQNAEYQEGPPPGHPAHDGAREQSKGKRQTQEQSQQTNAGSSAGQQEAPRMTIDQVKKDVCQRLMAIFTSKLMNERLMRMAGGDASRVAKNLTAFLTVITQDDGGNKDNNKKRYLCQCTIASLTTCFLESMNMQLPFDSRKLIIMIPYESANGLEAELDISYKGFVNALNRHFRNAFVECKLVFENDTFNTDISDRIAHYTYKPADPFAVVYPDFRGIKGGYCFFSYTDTDGKTTSRLVFLSRDQIIKNKSRARQQYVWTSDPKAMGEKTCIREGARLPFAAIDLDIDVEEVANRHYQLEAPENQDRLKLLMKAQEEVVNGVNDKPKSDDSASAADTGSGAVQSQGEAGAAQPEKEAARVDDGGAAGAEGSTAAGAGGGAGVSAAGVPAVDNAGGADAELRHEEQVDARYKPEQEVLPPQEAHPAHLDDADFEEE